MIRNYNLIRSILSEPWFISMMDADKMKCLLSGVFSPALAVEPMTKDEAAGIAYTRRISSSNSELVHNIGVVHITGALTKYDTLCDYGMESYCRMVREFASDDSVSAIVLCLDTPGGSVSGTEELGNEIRNTGKPVVGFVSDMAFSAGYWLAANCCEIIANNTTAQVGSIGVICTYLDLSKLYEARGIQMHEILPDQSVDKREEEQHIKSGNYDLTKERLGVLAEKFQNVVRAGRPGVNDDQLTGKTYFAKDVIGSLVDSIGSFETALMRAAELASENHNKTNINMSKPLYPTMAQAAGVEALESADGSINLTPEMAAAVETVLAGTATQATTETPKPHAAAPAESTDALQQRVIALENDIKAKDKQIAELGKTPGATGAAISPQTDANTPMDSPAESFGEAMAAANDFYTKFKS